MIDGDPANVVTQFDGWEVALQGLEAGDVIAQQVIIPVGEEVKPGSYELVAGLYSQQNWSRLPVAQGGEPRDHARLGNLEVTP